MHWYALHLLHDQFYVLFEKGRSTNNYLHFQKNKMKDLFLLNCKILDAIGIHRPEGGIASKITFCKEIAI